MIKIIDAVDEYKKILEDNLNSNIEDKIKAWEDYHKNKFPELEKKCKDYYEVDGYNWNDVAITKVFNRRQEDYSFMMEAYNNILDIFLDIDKRVKEIFSIDLDINIVIYVGLCNAAGWVDEYEGKRAMLFGIDKIAELRWETKEQLDSLVSHELCHVVHYYIRGEVIPKWAEKNKYNNGIWNIYEEGFAQYYENKLSKSQFDSRGENWIEICKEKERELKKLYIEALKNEERGTCEFYGDWFKVLGISDAGYYLGAKLIESLNEKYDINSIAKMECEDIEKEVMGFLRS